MPGLPGHDVGAAPCPVSPAALPAALPARRGTAQRDRGSGLRPRSSAQPPSVAVPAPHGGSTRGYGLGRFPAGILDLGPHRRVLCSVREREPGPARYPRSRAKPRFAAPLEALLSAVLRPGLSPSRPPPSRLPCTGNGLRPGRFCPLVKKGRALSPPPFSVPRWDLPLAVAGTVWAPAP